MTPEILSALHERINFARTLATGRFASTHEALGVAFEEWDELREQIRANNIVGIRDEALDLAAVLIRLAYQCLQARQGEFDAGFYMRSMK